MSSLKPVATHELQVTNRIIVLVGSSGSGKTTLADTIGENLGARKLVTTTTRSRRKGEVHGQDYYFISKAKFCLGIQNNEFVENTEYNNEYYGLTKDEIKDSYNSLCYITTDNNGARALADMYPERVMIFWLRSRPSLLFKRLISRGDGFKSALKRLINAFVKKEFTSPAKCFSDVSFTELTAEESVINNFGIIYYRLLVDEYNMNNVYFNKLKYDIEYKLYK